MIELESRTDSAPGGENENAQPTAADAASASEPAATESAPQDDMSWLMRDKFKGESIEEVIKNQAKAYPEILSKMGKFWGAPKEGDYDGEALTEYGLSNDDPIFKNLSPVLKEIGISNEGVKRLAAGWQDSLKAMSSEMEANLAQTLTQEDAIAVKQVDSWLKDRFTKDEAEQIKGWITTKEDFKTLNALRTMVAPSNDVPNVQGFGQRYDSVASIEREKIENNAKYKSDPAYRRQLTMRERDARERESRLR